MNSHSIDQLTEEWRDLLDTYPEQTQQRVQAIAEKHKVVLATHFYAQMLADEGASRFLSHQEVQSRLNRSLQDWIVSLYAIRAGSDLDTVVAQQIKTGEVHARISIPVHLVLRGARILKDRFIQLIERDWDETVDPAQPNRHACRLAVDSIDLAMEIMSCAYSNSHDRNARAEEAYRLFSVSQNLGVEKERQRAALLDWENNLMFDLSMGRKAGQLPRIGQSEFGLWFQHKGIHAFEGSDEAQLIVEAIQRIDQVLLPVANQNEPESQRRQLRELREQAQGIAYHLDQLFARNNEMESGRDVLTRLLNRKFLPVILGKQIETARKTSARFSLLMLDLDHFKQINDQHGHQTGDLALQQLAVMLVNRSRAGDYIFRMGGEEFLLLLVSITPKDALGKAQRLCEEIAAEAFDINSETRLNLTASIGLAHFDGHPDYQRLIREADQALYTAKNQGRNQVVEANPIA